MNQLARIEAPPTPSHAAPAPQFTLGEMERMATSLAQSRLFPGIQTPQAALTLMLVCQAEGVHPIQALKRYHIIEGRPSMRADAMQAEFQRAGGVVRWVRSDSGTCEARFIHPVHAPEPGFAVVVTLKELEESGVATCWDKDKQRPKLKDNYRKFARQMLRARAISEGVRAVLPEVVVGIYTPEEVQDFEPAPASRRGEPEAIDVEAEEEPAPPPPPPPRADRTPKTWAELVGRVLAKWAAESPCDAKVGEGRRKRLVNHLVTWGLDKGYIRPEDVSRVNAKGEVRRDDEKATAAARAMFDERPREVTVEAGVYLNEKTGEGDDAPDEAAPVAIPDLAPEGAGEAWEPDGEALDDWRLRCQALGLDPVPAIDAFAERRGLDGKPWAEWSEDDVLGAYLFAREQLMATA